MIRRPSPNVSTRLACMLVVACVLACGSASGEGGICPSVKPSCASQPIREAVRDPACNGDLASYAEGTWMPLPASSFRPEIRLRPRSTLASVTFGSGGTDTLFVSDWLNAHQDLELEIELAVDTSLPDPMGAYVTLFVDGLVIPLLQGDVESDFVRLDLVPGTVVRAPLRAAASRLTPGAHSAVVLFSALDGKELNSSAFTLLNQSTGFVDRPPPEQVPAVQVTASTASNVKKRGRGEGLVATPPDANGTLPLSLIVTPPVAPYCADLLHRLVVVALLDHHQIDVGELGPRPAFAMHDREAVELDVDIKNLPMDGEQHSLEVWLFGGDGSYSEAPLGDFSAWYSIPQQLGHVSWPAAE